MLWTLVYLIIRKRIVSYWIDEIYLEWILLYLLSGFGSGAYPAKPLIFVYGYENLYCFRATSSFHKALFHSNIAEFFVVKFSQAVRNFECLKSNIFDENSKQWFITNNADDINNNSWVLNCSQINNHIN